MKKLKTFSIVVFLLSGIVSSDVMAQSAFGVKGGLNLSTFTVSDPQTSYDSRTGYHAGIFFRERFSNVAIQPEILLSTQRTDATSNALGEYHDSFTYLNVPVMLKFYLVSGLNLQAGPQFGFLLDGERTGTNQILGDYRYDIKEYYDKSDISLSFGGGWDLPFGLNVDVRYNLGIKDINNQADGAETKSRVFQVALGWNFLR